MPGNARALPTLNEAAVESAIRIGLALGCEIVPWCRFARKNYFYPDMPKNLPDLPSTTNPSRSTATSTSPRGRHHLPDRHRARAWREDTGKLTHIGSETGRIHGATTSLLDFNRAGVPLIEIVTKPIEGPGTGAGGPRLRHRAAGSAARTRGVRRPDGPGFAALRRQRLAAADRPAEFGTRTETKNVNSLKSVEVAVRYEMRRRRR